MHWTSDRRPIWMTQNMILLLPFLLGYVTVLEATVCNSSLTLWANFTVQYLTSPNYPNPYPRPSSCTWNIKAAQGNSVVMRIHDFSLESSIFCFKDLFGIIDGHTDWDAELFSACGSYSSTGHLRTIHDMAIVSFRSVSRGSDQRGFNLSFWGENSVIPPYRPIEYDFINVILFGLSILTGASFLSGTLFLLRTKWTSCKR